MNININKLTSLRQLNQSSAMTGVADEVFLESVFGKSCCSSQDKVFVFFVGKTTPDLRWRTESTCFSHNELDRLCLFNRPLPLCYIALI